MPSPPDLRLPNVVIAGVTKAGTTSLHHYLTQHPDLAAADVKEVDHYAPMVHGGQPASLQAYAAHWAHEPAARWRLDASPRYFIGGPDLVRRLADDLAGAGDLRVLVTLREPVSRTWSSYAYKRSKGRLPDGVDFDVFVDRCQEVVESGRVRDPAAAAYRTLATGRYADHLGDWLDVLGDAVRLVAFEDLAADPAATTAAAAAWIGLDPAPLAALAYDARNATQQPRSQALKRVAQRADAALGRVVPRDSGARRRMRGVYDRLNSGRLAEQMTAEQRARLQDLYAEPAERLRALLAAHGRRDVPSWLRFDPAP